MQQQITDMTAINIDQEEIIGHKKIVCNIICITFHIEILCVLMKVYDHGDTEYFSDITQAKTCTMRTVNQLYRYLIEGVFNYDNYTFNICMIKIFQY